VNFSNVKLELIRLDAVYTVKRLIQEQPHGATGINPRRAVMV
jgi:hypothetical protein